MEPEIPEVKLVRDGVRGADVAVAVGSYRTADARFE